MNDELRKVIVDIQARYKTDPTEARVTFRSESALQSGLQSHVAMRDHKLTVDEPEVLGGTDTGPNPVELILGALGSCQEITYRAYATALGIPLDDVSVTLDGNIDLCGFFGVDDTVRAGYQDIKGTVQLTSSAPEADLRMLREAVNAHCPVLDIITKGVPVDLQLDLRQPATAAAE